MDPLREISFSAAPHDVTLSAGDSFGTAYVGDHVIVPTQFGFFRLNARTGEFVHRVGVTYQLGGLIPPGQVGFINGDYHQPVNALVANDRWIVTNNTAPVVGFDLRPAVIVWRNDADASLHGVVNQKRAAPPYPGTFDLRLGVSAHLRGDLLFLYDGTRYAVIDLQLLAWVGWQDTLPDGRHPASIDGYTYRYRISNDPWADGAYKAREYVALRSDVPVDFEPTPTPTPSPAPTPAPKPPQPEEPPMPPAPEVPPCPPGKVRNFMGVCVPAEEVIPRPIPPVDETVADFPDGIGIRLYVSDLRLPNIGLGKVVKLEGGTVAFRFNVGSLQIFVTVIDGRPVNGHWWVMSCGLTDVGCKLVATKGNQKKEYVNPQGRTFPTTLDTTAFAV